MKPKKCRYCKGEFIPYNSLQKCCTNYECIKKAVFEAELIAWEKRKKKLKEKLYTQTDWIKKTQKSFNAFIRERDKDKMCISCGQKLKKGNIDAGHLWSAGGHSNVRFNEFNVNAQCSRPCNKDKSGDINNYRLSFIERYGIDKLNELDLKAKNKKKWNIEERQEINTIYKEKLKELKKLYI